uniref:ribosomal protein S4 n=1 Tax=Gormaniella terricola TaxID=2904618 RepID=UPI0021CC8A98|nr:ribosomal protein S4 [Gormaniella terricola]UWV18296.1 ribosomal protein S4 [Gormaniella terricola]
MSRYLGPRLRITRRLGTLIGLTRKKPTMKPLYPDNPFGLRKVIPPGQHGRAKLFKKKPYESNEYDFLIRLKLKQRLRYYYGITEKQLFNYVELARKSKGSTGRVLLRLLEMRLDNIVFRLHMAPTIAAARQLISHGHILVNKKKVTIPSAQCKPNDLITAAPKIRSMELVSRFLKEFDMEKARFNRIVNILQFGKKGLTTDKNEILKLKNRSNPLLNKKKTEKRSAIKKQISNRPGSLLFKPFVVGTVCTIRVHTYGQYKTQGLGYLNGRAVLIQPLFFVKDFIGKFISVLVYDKVGTTYFAYPTAPMTFEMKSLTRLFNKDFVHFFGEYFPFKKNNPFLTKPGANSLNQKQMTTKLPSTTFSKNYKEKPFSKIATHSAALILMDVLSRSKRSLQKKNEKEKVFIRIAAVHVNGSIKKQKKRKPNFVKNIAKYAELRKKNPVLFRENFLYGNGSPQLEGVGVRFYAQVVSPPKSLNAGELASGEKQKSVAQDKNKVSTTQNLVSSKEVKSSAKKEKSSAGEGKEVKSSAKKEKSSAGEGQKQALKKSQTQDKNKVLTTQNLVSSKEVKSSAKNEKSSAGEGQKQASKKRQTLALASRPLNGMNLSIGSSQFLKREKDFSNALVSVKRNTATAALMKETPEFSVSFRKNEGSSSRELLVHSFTENQSHVSPVFKRKKIKECFEALRNLKNFKKEKKGRNKDSKDMTTSLKQKIVKNLLISTSNSLIKEQAYLKKNEKKRLVLLFSKLSKKGVKKGKTNLLSNLREKVLESLLKDKTTSSAQFESLKLFSFQTLALLKKQVSSLQNQKSFKINDFSTQAQNDVQLHLNLASLIDKSRTYLAHFVKNADSPITSSVSRLEEIHERSNKAKLSLKKNFLANLEVYHSLLKLNKLSEFLATSNEPSNVKEPLLQKIAFSKEILKTRMEKNRKSVYNEFLRFIMFSFQNSSFASQNFEKQQKTLVSKALSLFKQGGFIKSNDEKSLSFFEEKGMKSLTEQRISSKWLKIENFFLKKRNLLLEKLSTWKESHNISTSRFEKTKKAVEKTLWTEQVSQQNRILFILSEYKKEGILSEHYLEKMRALVLRKNICETFETRLLKLVQQFSKLDQSFSLSKSQENSLGNVVSSLKEKIQTLSEMAYQKEVSSFNERKNQAEYRSTQKKVLNTLKIFLANTAYPAKLNWFRNKKQISEQRSTEILQKMRKQMNLLSASEKRNLVLALENSKKSGNMNSLLDSYFRNLVLAFCEKEKGKTSVQNNKEWSKILNKISSVVHLSEMKPSFEKMEYSEGKQKIEQHIVKTWLKAENRFLFRGIRLLKTLENSFVKENKNPRKLSSLLQNFILQTKTNTEENFKQLQKTFERVYKLDSLLNSNKLDSKEYAFILKKILMNTVNFRNVEAFSSYAKIFSSRLALLGSVGAEKRLASFPNVSKNSKNFRGSTQNILSLARTFSPSKIRKGFEQLKALHLITTHQFLYLSNFCTLELQNLSEVRSKKGFEKAVRKKQYRFEKGRFCQNSLTQLSKILDFSKLATFLELTKNSYGISKRNAEQIKTKQKDSERVLKQKRRVEAYFSFLCKRFALTPAESSELRRIFDKKLNTALASIKKSPSSLSKMNSSTALSVHFKEIKDSLLSYVHFFILRNGFFSSRIKMLKKLKASRISKKRAKTLISYLKNNLQSFSSLKIEKSAKFIQTYLFKELRAKWISKLKKLLKNKLLLEKTLKMAKREFNEFEGASLYHNISKELLKELGSLNLNLLFPAFLKKKEETRTLPFEQKSVERFRILSFYLENEINMTKLSRLKEDVRITNSKRLEMKHFLNQRMFRKSFKNISKNPTLYRNALKSKTKTPKFQKRDFLSRKNLFGALKQAFYLSKLEHYLETGLINNAQFSLMKEKSVFILQAARKHTLQLAKLEKKVKRKFLNSRKYNSMAQKALRKLSLLGQKMMASSLMKNSNIKETTLTSEKAHSLALNTPIKTKGQVFLANLLTQNLFSPSLMTLILSLCLKTQAESDVKKTTSLNSENTSKRIKNFLSRTLARFSKTKTESFIRKNSLKGTKASLSAQGLPFEKRQQKNPGRGKGRGVAETLSFTKKEQAGRPSNFKKDTKKGVFKSKNQKVSSLQGRNLVLQFVRVCRKLVNTHFSLLNSKPFNQLDIEKSGISTLAFETLKKLKNLSSLKTSAQFKERAKQQVLSNFIIKTLLRKQGLSLTQSVVNTPVLNPLKNKKVSLLIQKALNRQNSTTLYRKRVAASKIVEKVSNMDNKVLQTLWKILKVQKEGRSDSSSLEKENVLSNLVTTLLLAFVQKGKTHKQVLSKKIRWYATRVAKSLRIVKYGALRKKLSYTVLKKKLLKKLKKQSRTKQAAIGFLVLKKKKFINKKRYQKILAKIRLNVRAKKRNVAQTLLFRLLKTKIWLFSKKNFLRKNEFSKQQFLVLVSIFFELYQQKKIQKAKYEKILSKIKLLAKYQSFLSKFRELEVAGLITKEQSKQFEQKILLRINQKMTKTKVLQKAKLYMKPLLTLNRRVDKNTKKVSLQNKKAFLVQNLSKSSILKGGLNFLFLRELRREKLINERQFNKISKKLNRRKKKSIQKVRLLIQNLSKLNKNLSLFRKGANPYLQNDQSSFFTSVRKPSKLSLGKKKKSIRKKTFFESILNEFKFSSNMTLNMLRELRKRKFINDSLYNRLVFSLKNSIKPAALAVNPNTGSLSQNRKRLKISVQKERTVPVLEGKKKLSLVSKAKGVKKVQKQKLNEKQRLAMKLFRIYSRRLTRLQQLKKKGLIRELRYRQKLSLISKAILKFKKSSFVQQNKEVLRMINSYLEKQKRISFTKRSLKFKGISKKAASSQKAKLSFVSKLKIKKIAAYKKAILSALNEGTLSAFTFRKTMSRLRKLVKNELINRMQYSILRKIMKKTFLHLALLKRKVREGLDQNLKSFTLSSVEKALYLRILKSYFRVEFKFLDSDLRKRVMQQQKFKKYQKKLKQRKARTAQFKNKNKTGGVQMNSFVRSLAAQLPPKRSQKINSLLRKLRQKLAFDEKLIKKIQPSLVKLLEKRYGPSLPIPPHLILKRWKIKVQTSLVASSKNKKVKQKYLTLPVGIVRDMASRKTVGLPIIERLIVEYYSRK